VAVVDRALLVAGLLAVAVLVVVFVAVEVAVLP
jgi:hypothetical protein